MSLYEYRANLLSVHDGDTITVDVDLGMRVHTIAVLRLNGINAPELNTLEGVDAHNYLMDLIASEGYSGTVLTIQTHKDHTEKYGRWLADIWRSSEPTATTPSINTRMITSGHAVPYNG